MDRYISIGKWPVSKEELSNLPAKDKLIITELMFGCGQEKDNNGQIVLYTGLMENEEAEVVPFKEKPAVLASVYELSGVKERGTLPSFSSIGCHTIVYYSKDEEPYCGDCASKHADEHNPISHAGTYDEGPDLECSECGRAIVSSYGDPEEDTQSQSS